MGYVFGLRNWIQNGLRNILLPGLMNNVLNLLEEFIGGMSVTPPRRGGTPPSGELLCVKREMSRITVYGWV